MPTVTHSRAGAAGSEVVVVTYHQFGAHSSALRNVTRADALAAQLDHFAANYNVISLDHLLAGELPGKPLLITIDDAYKSVAAILAPALKARRLPAVFFVNPRPILEPFVPWHDALAMAHALPRTTTCVSRSADGFSRMGFIAASGSIPAAAASPAGPCASCPST